MYCGKCGVKTQDSARFCMSCGAELRSQIVTNNTVQPNVIKPFQKKKKTPLIIALCLSIVFMLIIGATIFLAYSNRNSNHESGFNSTHPENNQVIIPPEDSESQNIESVAENSVTSNRNVPVLVNEVRVLVEPSLYFEDTHGFSGINESEPLAGVKINGMWGFIDKTGSIVIPCQYDNVGAFHNDRAAVGINGKLGFIDTGGNLVIPAIYDSHNRDFANRDKVIVQLNNLFGIIDKDGNEVVPIKYEVIRASRDGPAVAYSSEGGYDFIDSDGNVTLNIPSERYLRIEAFSEGLALVRVLSDLYQSYGYVQLFGYIDENGIEVIPPIYTDAKAFVNDRALVSNHQGSIGVIDKAGNVIIPFSYSGYRWSTSPSSMEYIFLHDGFTYVFDLDGNLLFTAGNDISVAYDDVSMFRHGMAYVIINGKKGFINKNFELTVPAIYSIWGSGDFNRDGVAVVVMDDYFEGFERFGLINTLGEELLPFEYEEIIPAFNGIILVKRNGLWGAVNIEGKLLIPIEYDMIRTSTNGMVMVRKGDAWGILEIDESKTERKPIP